MGERVRPACPELHVKRGIYQKRRGISENTSVIPFILKSGIQYSELRAGVACPIFAHDLTLGYLN